MQEAKFHKDKPLMQLHGAATKYSVGVNATVARATKGQTSISLCWGCVVSPWSGYGRVSSSGTSIVRDRVGVIFGTNSTYYARSGAQHRYHYRVP